MTTATKNWWEPVLGTIGGSQHDGPTTLEILAERGHFPVKEQPHKPKEAYLLHCPFHSDSHPSFTVHEDKIQWHCWTCGGGGPRKLREMLGGGLIPPMPRLPKAPKPAVKKVKERPSGCTLPPLVAAKSLPLDFLKSVMGWFNTDWYGTPVVGIDYGDGSLRYRAGLTGKDRFRWRKGSTPCLYWIDHLPEDAEYVLVVEGETDAAAATLLGIPAVGVPGVDTWKTEWSSKLAGRDVVLWQEPDEAGENLVAAMAEDIPGLRVIQAPPGIKDVCELLDQAGDGAGDMLRELMDDAQPYHQPLPGKADVGNDVSNRERKKKDSFPITDIRSQSQLWEAMKAYFPLHPGMKPWTVARAMYNHNDGKGLVAEFPSNGWGNPANAQLKRQRLGFNMLPRVNGPQIYELRQPFDDWDPQVHEAISRRINRAIDKAGDDADYGWVWFNNALDRGYYLYLTSVPGVSGFEPVEGDIEPVLIDALKAIHPPDKGEPGRFRPYGGSDNWTSRVEGTGEEDKDKWDIAAVSDSPADFVQVEAECIAASIRYEYTKPYWRQQIGPGLEMRMPFEEFMQLCSSLGYSPTRAGRLGLTDFGETEVMNGQKRPGAQSKSTGKGRV
jgi:hypothetical protein